MEKKAKILVGIKLLLGVLVLLQTESFLLETFLADDAFYYFSIAKNIVSKGCICFNDGVINNGFHPLYLILITPLFWFFKVFGEMRKGF